MSQVASKLVVAVSIVAGFTIHAMLQKLPVATYDFTNILFPNSININVPNPADTTVEMYENYAVIVRPSGEKTIVPTSFFHAIDVK